MAEEPAEQESADKTSISVGKTSTSADVVSVSGDKTATDVEEAKSDVDTSRSKNVGFEEDQVEPEPAPDEQMENVARQVLNGRLTYKKTGGGPGHNAYAIWKGTSVAVTAMQTDKEVRVGLTSDPDDNAEFPNGRFVGLFPDGRLVKKGLVDSTYDTSVVIAIEVQGANIVAYKNKHKVATWANAVGFQRDMYVKISFYEEDAMVAVHYKGIQFGVSQDGLSVPVPKDEMAKNSPKMAQLDVLKETKRKVSRNIQKRVREGVDSVYMKKGMDWSEWSKLCYERLGRDKSYGCACGRNVLGETGLCRICGTSAEPPPSEPPSRGPDRCWTDDLYHLCSPLLGLHDQKLNHSQRQYVLRAIRQRLKDPPWDWSEETTPVRMAIDVGDADLLFVMLEGSIDPNECDERGVTALHAAVFKGRVDLCSILIEGEADVNSEDQFGQTPLFFAPTVEMCKLLCDKSADLSMTNDKGQTALHLAGRAGLKDVLAFLKKHCEKSAGQGIIALADSFDITADRYLEIQAKASGEETPSPRSAAKSLTRKQSGSLRSSKQARAKSRSNSLKSGVRAPAQPKPEGGQSDVRKWETRVQEIWYPPPIEAMEGTKWGQRSSPPPGGVAAKAPTEDEFDV